jgi:signal transduction histidine kinase
MRTRKIIRDDRKSMYQLAITLGGRIVGETPAAGMGRILSETLGIRPGQGSVIEDYLQLFSRISAREDGRAPLVDRLMEAFHGFRDAYMEIQDDGEIPGTQGEYVLADGKEYHLHFTFRKERRDQKDHILFTVRNDTQTKRLEESLRRANEGLQGIMAYLLHDLRNIAGTNIQGPLSLIPDDAVDPAYHASLAIARRNAQTAFKVLSSNLHDFATGRLTIIKEEHDLCEIVRLACDNVSITARDKGITFHHEGPEKALLMADQKLISVFDNLMRNAVNYSPASSSIQCRITEAETEDPGDSYQVTIMNPAQLTDDQVKAIFDRGLSYSDQEGTGYGLSNVQTLLDYHGGGAHAEMIGGYLTIDVIIPKESDLW